jgi:hypothetical protein
VQTADRVTTLVGTPRNALTVSVAAARLVLVPETVGPIAVATRCVGRRASAAQSLIVNGVVARTP